MHQDYFCTHTLLRNEFSIGIVSFTQAVNPRFYLYLAEQSLVLLFFN